MKRAMKLACLLLLGFVTLSLWSQDDIDAGADKAPKTVTPPEAQSSGPGVPADYIIGADDTLHVTVWKEPDMSVTLPVRPDGKISVPFRFKSSIARLWIARASLPVNPLVNAVRPASRRRKVSR